MLLREFFEKRQLLEVDTPVLARSTVTDVNIDSVSACANGERAYLQTSPEYFMKRLLAVGSGDIYYLGKAFRDAEMGARHNPEFTLLEWYRCGWDEHQLIEEVVALVCQCLEEVTGKEPAVRKYSYADCFIDHCGIDPHQAHLQELQDKAADISNKSWLHETRANCLDLLFSEKIEPQLPDGLVVIYDYPACQAALAQTYINAQGVMVSHRFEAFLNRMELANGYLELADPEQQRQRFANDLVKRDKLSKSPVLVDENLMMALQQGIPNCAGVALGVDRLLMQLYNRLSIDQVMAFGWRHC